ncbi:mechanosensitive ion channel domain-containing protein [Campylobacter canadensis]|uniref:Mechanosensitive ion channel n=1 Tax=Campylobacter canadensis TaxID=449520 RepID=A0ABS7WPC0_9BACT|nr:mechanosensitive ion channel domain-containing protein [Campylobacter canadensis]MBZ7986609.1 mechanosensitive ion channel [Campylobacter canadensis]MBZ7993987.1 mechanosensitive ion channel [Campylobacter canadensis]MBZ7996302.1 mechanosensitive ion channel [Campylobacter canadensis]MBZ7997645.1 mechanosensitive ion channel [Campylobacter canadensis]MBZ7999318.1 mechanosensitive ion channel [Campylobacter canadensis]
MKKILALFLFIFYVFADNVEINTLQKEQIAQLKEQIKQVDKNLNANTIYTNYHNYLSYLSMQDEMILLKTQLSKAKKDKKEQLNLQIKQLESKIDLFKDYESYSLQKSLDLANEPSEHKKITNIYLILEGLNEKKHLLKEDKEFENKIKEFSKLISELEQKQNLLNELNKLDNSNKDELIKNTNILEEYKNTLDYANNSYAIFKAKINENLALIDKEIKNQYFSSINFSIIILCIFLIRYLVSRLIRKYVDDKDKVYSITKILNTLTFFIIALFCLFYFVENITYIVSILGFASAGLAIAMKDMFMSLLGWLTLQFGAGFHVGDRIKVTKNGVIYVGDIIDISLLKMTLYEDVTYTTLTENRRAGRIIYIPNNYIFTDLISNYNYSYLKTVWDGIDIYLDYSSNIDKAKQIILDSASLYSNAYADSAKKAIQKMRNHYQMKNSGTDAKIFVFIEQFGVRISVWYMANSREVLKMRSIISEEIIKRFKEQGDIKLAFPTQSILINSNANTPFKKDNSEDLH